MRFLIVKLLNIRKNLKFPLLDLTTLAISMRKAILTKLRSFIRQLEGIKVWKSLKPLTRRLLPNSKGKSFSQM